MHFSQPYKNSFQTFNHIKKREVRRLFSLLHDNGSVYYITFLSNGSMLMPCSNTCFAYSFAPNNEWSL